MPDCNSKLLTFAITTTFLPIFVPVNPNLTTVKSQGKDVQCFKSPYLTIEGRKYTIVTSYRTEERPYIYYHDVKNDRGEYKTFTHEQLMKLAQNP